MREEKVILNGKDIFYHVFDDVDNDSIKGVVQIVHGIAEHSLRYCGFANYLNKLGYVVYASDHPGHGKSTEKLGVIDGDAMETIISSVEIIYNKIKEDYPNEKKVLFGHSMGSFISLRTVELRPMDYNALILSGTDGPFPKLLTSALNPIAKILSTFGLNTNDKTNLGETIFGSYNKGFEGRTKHDWINTVAEEVDKYENDPLSGFDIPNKFALSLVKNMPQWFKDSELSKIYKELPILVISGEKDPVGHFGKGPMNLCKGLNRVGNNKVLLRLYKGARHEILLETIKDEVYSDISLFLNDYI